MSDPIEAECVEVVPRHDKATWYVLVNLIWDGTPDVCWIPETSRDAWFRTLEEARRHAKSDGSEIHIFKLVFPATSKEATR